MSYPAIIVAHVFSHEKHQNVAKEVWDTIAPCVVPGVSASAAISINFGGFMKKSAAQLGNPIPKLRVTETLYKGFQVAPTLGVIIGAQAALQGFVEGKLSKDRESKDITTMLGSALIVGGLSAHALAAFNGLTTGKSIVESVKNVSLKQGTAVVGRETSFLFALSFTDPLSKSMKDVFGNTLLVHYGSAFASGAIVSLVGHPADTALTIWQDGKTFKAVHSIKNAPLKTIAEYAAQSMKGATFRAIALGRFGVCYKAAKDAFAYFEQK